MTLIRLQSEHGAFLRTETLPAGHMLPEALVWNDAQFALAASGGDGVSPVYRRMPPGPVRLTAKVARVVVVSAPFLDLCIDGTVPA